MISSEISTGPADLAGDVPIPEPGTAPLADTAGAAEADGWAGETGSQVDVDSGLLDGSDDGRGDAPAAEASGPAADAAGGGQTIADRLLAPRDASTDNTDNPGRNDGGRHEAAAAEEAADGADAAVESGPDAAAGGSAGGGARDGDLPPNAEVPDPERGEPDDDAAEASSASETAVSGGEPPLAAGADVELGIIENDSLSDTGGPYDPTDGETIRTEVAPESGNPVGFQPEAAAGPSAGESSWQNAIKIGDEETSGNDEHNDPQIRAGGTAGTDTESDRPKTQVERPFKTAVPVGELSAGRDLGHDRNLMWVSEGSPTSTQGLTVDPGLARILMERAEIDKLVIGFHRDADSTYTQTYPTPYEIRYFGDDSHKGAILSFNREEQASRAVHTRRPGESAEAAWARQLSRATAAATDRIANRAPNAHNEDNERSLGKVIRDTFAHLHRVPATYRFLTKPKWQVVKEPTERSE